MTERTQRRNLFAFSHAKHGWICLISLVLSLCLTALAQTPAFDAGVSVGTITSGQIWEASGLAASRQNPGVLWTHNDNRFVGSVFAIATNGTLLARYDASDVFSGDFEDIAIGPGPSPGVHYIYLGDIGDNTSSRENIRIFRIPEPAVYAYQSNAPPERAAGGIDTLLLTYPDGPHNAEALLVDPLTGDLFIGTKATNGCRLYQATRAALQSTNVIPLAFVRELSFFSVSAGDISPDGTLIAMRRSNRANLWVRTLGQSIGAAMSSAGERIPVIGQPTEPNGEALAFAHDGQGYHTLSEGFSASLYYFARTNGVTPRPPHVIVPAGDTWRYQDTGDDEGTVWRAPDFDDTYWNEGKGQLGYGQGDEYTEVSFGWSPEFKNTTTYFRKRFSVESMEGINSLVLRLCYNDGLALYLNGAEVLRRNLAPNATFGTPANAPRAEWQNVWVSYALDPSLLVIGENTLAVELHRYDSTGPDLSFDLQIIEGQVDLPAHFTNPPQFTNGMCRLALEGPAGILVDVEASTDLHQWTTAGQVILHGGIGLFEESVSGTSPRFYRIGTRSGPFDY